MAKIRDKHRKRKDTDSDPLNKIGNRNEKTNEVDYDEKTISDQKNKE